MHSKPLLATAFVAMTMLFACSKKKNCDPAPSNSIKYRSLGDVQVKNLQSYHLDIDLDGTHNVYLALGVTGDATGTTGKFFAAGINSTKLLVKVDSTICLQQNEVIKSIAPHPRDWKGMESYLVEAHIPAARPNDTVWTGDWLSANRKYIGFQFTRDNIPYMGWICVSMDRTHLALILHGCAWRRISEGDLPAGTMPAS
ncbi:hypothetical protein ACQKLP_18495 [Chitinophaga sp. NPDC101104]|uniref:hypothetical protein n=1 Tax=Chitinophaga sp. NPDC101104 TaxID=3390561 RepID=UPI003D0590E9